MVKCVKNLKIIIGVIALLGAMVYSMTSHAASITVHSDRNPVNLNESFHIIYKSDGSVDDDPDFSPLENVLDILSRSQSSNMSFINGKYSSNKTWTLTVMAKREGTVTLPPISFGSDKSLSYRLKVKPASKTAATDSLFYSRLEVDQQQAYAQQQVVVTQQLFSARNLSAYGMGELDFNGKDVVVRKLGDEKQYQTRVGDREYLVIERSYAVFPQTDGLLQISPVLAEGRLATGRSSIFNSIGSGEVVRARSNALSIAVLPVPQNIDVDPWLPARQLQLEEQWTQNPPHFVVGEPLTRTISIKAEGLTAAQLPELPPIDGDGWKQYPDQPLLNDIDNDDGVTGYRVEKVALIPTRAGKLTLPAIEIKWWNTLTQQTQVAKIPARTVQVAAALKSNQSAGSAPALPAPAARTPPPISTPGQQTAAEPAMAKTDNYLWQAIAAALAVAWLLTLVFWWLQSRRKPVAVSSPLKARPSKDLLKPMKVACQQQDLNAFRQALLRWGEAQFKVTQGLTLQQISERLPQTLGAEIRKLDAVLYGAKGQAVDCQLMVREIEQFALAQKNNVHSKNAAPLEPLYR
jgi:hypothetical protein